MNSTTSLAKQSFIYILQAARRRTLRNWARKHLHDDALSMPSLTKDQIRQAKDFFRPYHRLPCTLFHRFYTGGYGSFDPRFIPDDLFYSRIDPFLNDWEKAYKLDDKCYYDRLLSQTGFTPPDTICQKAAGVWLDAGCRPISEQQAFDAILSRETCFIKEASLSWGAQGVHCFEPHAVQDARHRLQNLLSSCKPDIVIQDRIAQSPVTGKLHPSSVNTIRAISLFLPDGEVKVLSSVLRMGRGLSRVDNISFGGISCGINDDGSLKEIGHDSHGKALDRHPDTGIPFSSVKIPGFPHILDTIRNAHPQFPHFRLLSWDIALDIQDTPILVEINMRCGQLDFHQLNNGPLFKEDTTRILEEVFR